MKICGIYQITNLVNGKVIIGQSRNIIKRWRYYRNNLNRNVWCNPHLQNAWNKYGEKNFKFEILLECPLEKLNDEEKRLIMENKANDREYGYNMTEGGESPSFSEETRQKMRMAKLGKYDGEKHPQFGKSKSEETRQKMRENNTGSKNHNYGKAMSEEQKAKISIAHKRYWAQKKAASTLPL